MSSRATWLASRAKRGICCTLLAASTLHAQREAAQPERPTVATHAGTVAAGVIEIETGIERDHAGASSFVAPNVVKLGLASHAQLSVSQPIVHAAASSSALGDLALGVKWRVADKTLFGDLAILPSIKLPTGSVDRGAGTGTTDFSLLGIASRDMGPVHLDVNAGYTHRSGDGSAAPRSATVWTAAFSGGAVGRFGWTAEEFGYPRTSGRAASPRITAVLAGPTFAARPWLVLDAGLITPITGPQPHALYMGAVYNAGHVR